MTLPMYYCFMCRNNLLEVRDNINLVSPYVDGVIAVDGGSVDGSIFYLRNRDDVHMFLHPWKDHFSDQRNNYIKRAWEVNGNKPFACLVSDPDEYFSVEALSSLPNILKVLEEKGANCCAFRCDSQTLKGDQVVHHSHDDYYKNLLFIVTDPTEDRYINNPHETLLLKGGRREIRTDLVYFHRKQENIIWAKGCRNLICGGGGPNLHDSNKLWVELKQIYRDVYGKDMMWHDFENEMIKGNIDQRIKEWFYKARLQRGYDGASEHVECHKYYFKILHPEEEPEEMRSEQLP